MRLLSARSGYSLIAGGLRRLINSFDQQLVNDQQLVIDQLWLFLLRTGSPGRGNLADLTELHINVRTVINDQLLVNLSTFDETGSRRLSWTVRSGRLYQ